MENKGNILIVDDDYNNLKVLGKILRDAGFNVAVAPGGKDALYILKSFTPDLILLDIMMPDIDGVNVIKNLKNSFEFRDIPVIFQTAMASDDDFLKGFELGAVDYITKPYNAQILLSRVSTHVELRKKSLRLEFLNKNLEKEVEKRTEELNNALEKLSELDTLKTEFIQVISHELRTPLNGIIGFTELARIACNNENAAEYLNVVNNSVKRLEQFSMSALYFSYIRARKRKFNCQHVSIKEIALRARANDYIFFEKPYIDLRVEIENEQLYADIDLIEICVRNLIKVMAGLSTAPNLITIRNKETKDKLLYSFTYSGKKLPDNIRELTQNAFSQGKLHVDGIDGIDMPLCFDVMRLHNGDIRFVETDGLPTIVLEFLKAQQDE